ncbi:ABC transporter permease [Proteiniborus sp. MB09-C3]|uniref:ABC transporter permease n=1 Tax=Proteiniborus sp. MB09-C3 TaxID=3050072 RepID=UPI002557A0D6|nr:ABC transporter permease [Proteiniborus sp. MB09-C3]WIV13499.1 ABC transporter permease [Proteiniborus sp. MB09-C3]
MLSLVKNNLKLFFKNRYLSLGFIAFFVIINAYLIEGMYKLSIHKDALYYLQISQKLSIVYFIFFLFVSYEYLMKSKNDHILECFLTMDRGILKLYISKLIVLIMIILIMTLNVMVYNYISYFATNIKSISFAYHVFLNNLLNVFLVSFLGSCIGIIISLYLKKFLAYLLMIFLGILVSPISEFVPYVFFMGFGIDIYPLREIFNILPPNLDWFEETLYGLSIEPYRWNLQAFWTCLLSYFILLKFRIKKSKLLNFITMSLLLFSAFNFYLYTNSGSIVKKDYNPKGYIAFDELYYRHDVQKEETADFSISAYSMELIIDRQLYSDIKISLNEKKPLDSYKFTLYRNYKVKKILDKDNKILEFKRDGDYLEILNPTSDKLEEIRITYSGYSPVFYSNSQGVLLPGSFPYYPIEGYNKIYIKQQSVFIPIAREYNVNFDATIKSKLDIYSNLNKDKNNFSGKAQVMTLVGGFVEEKKVGDNTFYSLVLKEQDITTLLEVDNLLKPYISIFPHIERLNIMDKKVFQIPGTFYYKVLGGGIVSYSDHIFVRGLDKDNLTYGFLQSTIPQDSQKMEIKNMFFEYLIYEDRTFNIPKVQFGDDKAFELRRLFFEKVEELGEDYVIKSIYDFLCDKDDRRDPISFIRSLTKGGL